MKSCLRVQYALYWRCKVWMKWCRGGRDKSAPTQHREKESMSERYSRKRTRERERRPLSHLLTGLIGGVLLGIAVIWIGLLVLQRVGVPVPAFPTIGGIAPPFSQAPVTQITPLVAEGITLGSPTQNPGLNQQQALLLASEVEPDAATHAKVTGAKYVLLTYPNMSTPATHPSFNGVPVWMISYQQIPQQSSPQSTYDLYVFLDATSGKELLSVRV